MMKPASTRRLVLACAGIFLAAGLGSGACSDGPAATENIAPGSPEPLALATSTPGAHDIIFARIHYHDADDLQRLAAELDLLENADRKAGWVEALLDFDGYQGLLARGYRVDIVSHESPLRPRAYSSSGIQGYPCYRTVEETEAAMSTLASDHPDLARVVDIGDSWEKTKSGGSGGHDLRVLQVTNRAIPGPKPVFFLMGAIHAREYVTAETAMRFAEQMVNGHGTDPDATWLLDNYELHVLPQANPDGRKIAEQGYYQRKNRDTSAGGWCSNPPTPWSQAGTDLNRNSTFRWGGAGASQSPCDQMYRGASSGSEPETQAIQAYLASIFPDQRGPKDSDAAPADASGVFLSLHSYGPYVLYPWAWTSAGAPNGAELATLGRKFGYFNGYPVCQPSTCLYSATGSTDDWTYGALGVASFTFEMGTTFFQECGDYENTVAPANLPAILYAFKAARRPYQAPAGPDSLEVSVSASPVSAGTTVTLTTTSDATRYASNGYGQGAQATHDIAAARYSVDGASWTPGITSVAMSAADSSFDATNEDVTAQISTAGWAVGRHLLMVESQGADGNWGVPSAVFLDIQ